MALFEKLKDTRLKSLKFGATGTPGDSTKPYVVTDINTVDTPFNRFRLTKFDDGFIRGGAVGAANASAVDTVRISKFLTDFPKGPLFIAKQVGLQFSNPSVETREFGTTRGGILGSVINGATSVINKLNGLVGGNTRIYNLGINTLAQVPLNAFGGHIVRHGFLPFISDSQKYESVVTGNNKDGNNRLKKLLDKHFQTNSAKTRTWSNVFEGRINSYLGGADSIYGIGRTTIRKTTFTGREFDINASLERSRTKSRNLQQGVTEPVYDINTIYQQYKAKYDKNAKQDDFKQSKILNTTASSLNRSFSKTNGGVINYIFKLEPISSYLPRKNKLIGQSPNSAPSGTLLQYDPTNKLYSKRTDIPEPRYINTTFGPNIVQYNTIGSNTRSSVINPDSGSNTIYKKFISKDPTVGTDEEKFRYKKPLTTSPSDISSSLRTSQEYISNSNIKYTPPGSDGNKDFIRPFADTKNATYNKLINNARTNFKGDSYTWIAPSSADKSSESAGDVIVLVPKKTISIDRQGTKNPLSPFTYFDIKPSGKTNLPYDRDDKGIMPVSFSPLNPFDAKRVPDIIFPSYITGYNESYDSSWDSIKYNGRSEFLYTFNSYKKTANFKLKIPSFNNNETVKYHEDLQYLQEGLAGAYRNNLLGGIIVYVNLGYYLRDVPCIINSMNVSIPDEASWDFDFKTSDGTTTSYAMLLEANFNLTVLGNSRPGHLVEDARRGSEVTMEGVLNPTAEDIRMNQSPQ